MSSEGRRIAQGWHRFQKTSGSCVAACRAIVDAWSGGEGEEYDTYPALVGELLGASLPENLDVLAGRVKRREVAIVTVVGRSWMELARAQGLRSLHGDLGDGLHAVVIIATIDNFFVVLDPFFPTKDQPVQVSRDDFAAAWSGQVEFVGREG